MSYLQTYQALTDIGAPIAPLGRTRLAFYATDQSAQLHGDPTCVTGAAPRPVHTTLEELADGTATICQTCGPAVLASTVTELSYLGVRHTDLAATIRLTAQVRESLLTWSADADSAGTLLDRCIRLLTVSTVVADFVALARARPFEPALLDWMTTVTDEASAALAAAAVELRTDTCRTSALTGVPLDGPHRWVLLERVAFLLRGTSLGMDQRLTLVAYWPRVGTTPTPVTPGQQLLVAVPDQLADRLMNPTPGATALRSFRHPTHLDAGPASPGDDPNLAGLALTLMATARPTDPLGDPCAAVIAARGVLVAA